jgi:hypothetical protein
MNKSHALVDIAGTILLSAGMLCLDPRKRKHSPRGRRTRILPAVATSNRYGGDIDPALIVQSGVEAVVHGAALALVAWAAYELGKQSQAHGSSIRLRLCKPSLN